MSTFSGPVKELDSHVPTLIPSRVTHGELNGVSLGNIGEFHFHGCNVGSVDRPRLGLAWLALCFGVWCVVCGLWSRSGHLCFAIWKGNGILIHMNVAGVMYAGAGWYVMYVG